MTAVVATPDELIRVRAIIEAVLPGESRHVWVFGSRAKGTTKRYADLDLAIDIGRPLLQKELIALTENFEASDLPFKVEVVDLQTAGKAFIAAIHHDFIPLE